MLKVLLKEIEARERAGVLPQVHRHKQSHGSAATLMTGGGGGTEGSLSCCYCQGSHQPSTCGVVTDVETRQRSLRRQARCFNCLRKGHLARDCRSGPKCSHCKGRHHSSICNRSNRGTERTSQTSGDPILNPGATPFTPNSPPTSTSLYSGSSHSVLLQTALAIVLTLLTQHLILELELYWTAAAKGRILQTRLRRGYLSSLRGDKRCQYLHLG